MINLTRFTKDGTLLYTEQPDQIANGAAQLFIDDLHSELEKGYGFVPFIGAGLSAPSGAPLVWEIKSYLERCIGLALGVEEPGMRAWNPRTDQWPPFVDRERTATDDWWVKVRDEFERRRNLEPHDREIAIYQEALGAMTEWRTALQFLSRLVREKRGNGARSKEMIAMDAPDQEVIDACVREVLKGKQPTLGHRMLASLGGLLRLNIILTTNFDDLLERAFADARNPLTVFEVHLNSNLPSAAALSNHRSLVKLHGHRHSMRADFSTDALPTESDRWRFIEYLLSPAGRRSITDYERGASDTQGRLPFQSHLLVMGCSATERRMQSFIEHAWEHLDPAFRVYWLCHTTKDVESVQNFTRDFATRARDRSSSDLQRSRVLRFPQLGLLFLQMYQSIRRGLPYSGMIFPSVSRLALPTMQTERGEKKDPTTKNYVEQLQSRIKAQLAQFRLPGYQHHKLVVVTSAPSARGATSVCAAIYDDLFESGHSCLWLDMNDISSADDLFEQLLDAAYYRLGTENWMPVYVSKDPRKRGEEIRRLAQSKNSSWVIFLNARETPGANVTEYNEKHSIKYPNDWLDISRGNTSRSGRLNRTKSPANAGLSVERPDKLSAEDPSRCQESFLELLTELCGPQSPSISVVLLCREVSLDAPIIRGLRNNGMIEEALRLEHTCVTYSEDETLVKAIQWTDNKQAHRRFLHALSLMQRVRLLATIWSAAVSHNSPGANESDSDRTALLRHIVALETSGLVRRKPGGFIWMHTRARNRLRTLLGSRAMRVTFCKKHPEVAPYLTSWNSSRDECEIHNRLAQWYRHVLATSNSPAALFEAVYHLCHAARTSLRTVQTSAGEAFACARIEEASSLLRTHSYLIQTHGYSRGSCRRLEFIRDELCARLEEHLPLSSGVAARTNSVKLVNPIRLRSAISMLRIRSTEVMRAVAREVGEDARAYQRQREIRALFCSRTVADANLAKLSGRDMFRALFPLDGSLLPVPSTIDIASEWIRWWKWNAMLGIASRSYKAAARSLEKALRSASNFYDLKSSKAYPFRGDHRDEEVADEDVAVAVKKIRELYLGGNLRVFGTAPISPNALGLELLRVIEQFAALRLLKSSLTRRKGKSEMVLPISEHGNPGLTDVIDTGIDLAEQIVSRDHSADAHYTISAHWCKSRLLMHKSIQATSHDDWSEAMKLLGDSEACLNYHDVKRHGPDRAVIELHRAEVRLREAGSVMVLGRSDARHSGCLTFDSMCERLSERDYPESLLWRSSVPILRRTLCNDIAPSIPEGLLDSAELSAELRKTRSLVQESMRFLSRAEHLLLNRRRNVWWTTWYFQRKLQSISMTIWSSVAEVGTPIPFLGLEAAPRKTPTEADTLLEDSLRMIRVDAYRLATVIDSYRSAAIALHVRLLLDNCSIRLPDRQRRMYDQLCRSRQ